MSQDPEQMQCPCCCKDFIPRYDAINDAMTLLGFDNEQCDSCGCVISIRDNGLDSYPVLDCDNPNIQCLCEDHNTDAITAWIDDQLAKDKIRRSKKESSVIATVPKGIPVAEDRYLSNAETERIEHCVDLARNSEPVVLLMKHGYTKSARIICSHLIKGLVSFEKHQDRVELLNTMIEGCLYDTNDGSP